MPYSVAAEPWSDGATARRWVAIPGDARIALAATENAKSEFPDGTVLVKHLSLPRPKHGDGDLNLETQLLHFESGTWNPYTYLWNAEGTDATLVRAEGSDITIQEADDPKSSRMWHAGSVNECRLCHSAGSGFVLGFSAKQLRKIVVTDNGHLNQIGALASRHVLTDSDTLRAIDTNLVNPHDASQPLNARARSYLHANCGVCHHRKGPETISFYAHADYAFDELRITKRPGIGKFGLETPQLVKPNDAFRSVILYRMSKLGYGRMPYVGSRVVDSRGVSLIAQWIDSIPAPTELEPPHTSITSNAARSITLLSKSDVPSSAANDHIESLLQSSGSALALTTAMHRGELAPKMISSVTAAAKSKHGDIRGLFDHFVPESNRRRILGPNPDTEQILLLAGDSNRGELIFLSDNHRCRTCHDVSDASKSVGPTLHDMRRIIKRPELLLHIIEPSRRVDEKFSTWTITTSDGQIESGLLISKGDDSVQLRKADRSIVTIDHANIDTMQKSPGSLMPNGLLSDMTAQQAADLLAYLIDKSKQ